MTQNAAPDLAAPDLAIVVCTFKRNELLRQLLASLKAQRAPEGFRACVYIVDNSDEGLARLVVEEEAGGYPLPLRWIEAHPANLSVARNAGARAGSEAFVAFVDDDQVLQQGWLEAVALATRNEVADVWLGRVIGDFETPEKATAGIRALFSREMEEEAGHELFAFGPRKPATITLGSGNSVFRRATTLTGEHIFDLRFGKGGGEDFDLYCRLQRRGKRFFWLPEAAVLEVVPGSRCERAYLRRRFFAGGQAFAAAIAHSDANPRLTRWIIRAKAAVQAGLLAFRAPVALLSNEAARADYAFNWAAVLGKLSFGEIYPLYQSKSK